MGTSIVATLAHIHGFGVVSCVCAAMAVGILVFVTAGWLRNRNPAFAQKYMAPWGMYSMGIMACGSALTAVTGNHVWQLGSWWIGAPLGLVVCLNQLRKFSGEPTFQWALALVAPMVAATSAGQLGYRVVGLVAFCLAFFTALPVFARVYVALARGTASISSTLGGTAWIPLGIVGQSTAAAQVLFPTKLAVLYGAVMLSVGVAPALVAAFHFGRSVFTWAGYSPGWWGATFPVGTVCLGLHLLAATSGRDWLDTLSLSAFVLLSVHWMLCVTRFLAWFLGEHHPSAQ